MASKDPLINATDAWITSKRPKHNHSTEARLKVSAGGDGNTQRAFIYYTPPFPKGTNVLDGKFRLKNAKAITGTVTVTVSRVVTKWRAGKVNWDNQPDITSTNASQVTLSNAPADSVWEFDVTDILQTVAVSGDWWGFRITVNSDAPVVFYSANANSINRPELEVEWSDAPEPPEELYPSGGRAVSVTKPLLMFDFVDQAGNQELNACQVLYSSSPNTDPLTGMFTTITWDSGVQNISEPELDTALVTGAPTLTSTLTYWMVRVQDGSGAWSDYSDPESMKYTANQAVTLTSPGSGASNFVTDATPPILWSVVGVQTAYKATISTPDDPNTLLWNSGKITTTETGFTLPAKVIKKANTLYRLTLRVWDDKDREKNGTNKIYTEVIRDFTYKPSTSVTEVTNVIADQDPPWPWVNVTFDRTTAADEYNILRDGEIIEANIAADDVIQPDGSYKYVDRLASPRENHIWKVQSVVNGEASPGVDSNTLKTRLLTTMMMELDGTNPIYFMNPQVDPQSMTMQEVHQPLNAPPILVTQYMGGYEGHLEGLLVDDILPGLSARQMRNKFKKWKKNTGSSYYLYLIDEVLEIVPYNMTYKPEAKGGSIVRYRVSFDFFEVGDQ